MVLARLRLFGTLPGLLLPGLFGFNPRPSIRPPQ